MIPHVDGYLRFPRVYLHITPSQTGTHVHAPASAPGFSHWTSIRSLSSEPLRLFVSASSFHFFSFVVFFLFFLYLREHGGVKDWI